MIEPSHVLKPVRHRLAQYGVAAAAGLAFAGLSLGQ